MTNEDTRTIYAFAQVDNPDKKAVYDEIGEGKSRFGWGQEDKHNLTKHGDDRDNSRQKFLLRIKAGDWIVHVNSPEWGKCVAVKTTGGYGFDTGITLDGRTDYRHYIPIDTDSIIPFDRKEAYNSINLAPRSRWHQVYEKDDFLDFIEKKKTGKDPQDDHPFYSKANDHLKDITTLMQKYNPSKNLENYFAAVFEKVPGVSHVEKTGQGWGTDHGVDLLVEYSLLPGLASSLTLKLAVQIKSYSGTHEDTIVIDQLKSGIEEYDAHSGLIISTAKKVADSLEEKLANEENIQIIYGTDVARFAVSASPEMIFGK